MFKKIIFHNVKKWEYIKIKTFTDPNECINFINEKIYTRNLLLTIEDRENKFELKYFLLPEISGEIFWKRKNFDGTLEGFEYYTTFPYTNSKLDIILVDGRNRVSCLKRMFYGKLLSKNAYLFVHDAHRKFYDSAFSLFKNGEKISSSNMAVDGKVVFPLNTGINKDELFIFRNEYF